jgi:uncharacterized protein (TIGR02453 family)
MTVSTISRENFDFLNKLKKNNNRDWFTENKKLYQKCHQNTIAFADSVLQLLNTHDNIETETGKKSLFRIYRDVRFSKDKTPYQTHWSGGFRRATKLLRGGYYFRIKPGESVIAGGFWGPNSDDIKMIRQEISSNDKELREIITSKDFVDTFGSLEGEKVKTAPKGYSKDHPAIDLLRHKQFIIHRSFTDDEVLSPEFAHMANETFVKMRPFFNYMSEVLTTDENGVPLY